MDNPFDMINTEEAELVARYIIEPSSSEKSFSYDPDLEC